MIKQCIVTMKVFLVVDNVGVETDMKDLQVHAFKEGLKGSKVIVTTRRRDILYDYREGIFDVELLNEKEASELFSFYAFHGVNDDEERMQLDDQAKAIMKACGELPLSLEVIGQYLRKYNSLEIGERMDIWDEALRRLQEAKPFDGHNDDEKLWARLKISYDDLAEDEQSMLLDFACVISETWNIILDFCVNKDWLARLWNSSIGVQNLINMSLIKWNEDPDRLSLVMHDQVRDMGWGIVRKMVDGSMSRIWKKDEGLRFTLQSKNLKTVEGLSLISVKGSEFDQQKDLAKRGMEIGGASHFEKLRLLDLRNSDLQAVEHYVQLCSGELTWLCLDRTKITVWSIRELASFIKLRVLEMSNCRSLEELPTSIGNLSLLKELQLSYCTGLKTLPDTIGNLKSLQILILVHCTSLESLPTSIGRLNSLRRLDCLGCESLTAVPAEVAKVNKLEYLSFGHCSKLKTLCIFEAKMNLLRELILTRCLGLETINLLGNLCCVKTLTLCYSENLCIDNLPDQLGQLSQLQRLDLRGCKRLEKGILETFQKGQLCTGHLEELLLSVFPDSELSPCPRLEILDLINENQTEKLPESLGNLSHLEGLGLFESPGSPGLKVLPDASCNLERLTNFRMIGLHLPERLPKHMDHLSSLQSLWIINCTKLVELPSSLGDLSQLQRLYLENCRSLERLPEPLVRLTRLFSFGIFECNKLQLWESDQSSILQQLKASGCNISPFRNREKNIALLQLIDAGADRHVIRQFIEEVQSQPPPRSQTRRR